ncbi:MAG: cation diffusion facilitator family transporter [Armatimonadota bacterium]
MTKKVTASVISIIYVIVIAILKVAVGLYINSIAILSEALDSIGDLAISLLSYFLIKKSEKPPDKDHPYGHGKFETLSAALESIFILSIAVFIVIKAVKGILYGNIIGELNLGILVMAVSLISKIVVSNYLFKTAKSENSIALEGRAHNFKADIWREAGVLVSLIIIKVTGINIIDPIVGLLVACIILFSFFKLIRKTMKDLIDESLPEEEEKTIREILDQHMGQFIEYHNLRTRSSGSVRYVDLHLVLKPTCTLAEAHKLCDHLEIDIKQTFTDIEILIHAEPCHQKPNCDHDCENCHQ